MNVTIAGFLLAALVVPTTSAQPKWRRLPSLDQKPAGLELVYSGTTLHASSGMTGAAGLVVGDSQRATHLTAGKSEAVLKFARQSVVQHLSFISDGIEGGVLLSTSSDGKGWTLLARETFTPADRLIKLETAAAQGRFVRLQFDLVTGGTIRALQVIGAVTDANYTITQNADGTGAPLNFATGIGGGRLIYLSHELFGPRTDAMKNNRIVFPVSDAQHRTAVYDLGQMRSLNEFSSVHSPRPVRFTVYAFDALPEKEDWRGRLTFDPAVFDSCEPVVRADDRAGVGHLIAKPSIPIKARYLALRWEPDFNPPGFSAYSVSISGFASISYSGPGVNVTTTGDGNGGMQAVVTVDGNVNLTISIDANGNVTVTGADGEGSLTVDAGGETVDGDLDEPFTFNGVTLGAPSAIGAGMGSLGIPEPPAASGGGGGGIGAPGVGGGGNSGGVGVGSSGGGGAGLGWGNWWGEPPSGP